MNDLSQRLKDIVPTPPDPTDLSGIATRSAADGRRRRTQRRFAAVASVVVLAAGGVVLPRVLDDGPPDVAERSEPQCVASPDAPLEEIETQEATWVRFCEPAEEGATRQVRFQRGVVTGGLATAVVQSWADRVVDRTCGPETPPVPSRLFRIQIGLADGSVTEIAGDTSCVDDHLLFLNMETPLLLQGGIRKDEVVQPRQVTCPDGLTTTETNWDGADADELREDPGSPAIATTPLMPGQISAVDVVRLHGRGRAPHLPRAVALPVGQQHPVRCHDRLPGRDGRLRAAAGRHVVRRGDAGLQGDSPDLQPRCRRLRCDECGHRDARLSRPTWGWRPRSS